MAVHQALEYASSCRLADGRGNSGDRRVPMMLDVHTLMLDELLIPETAILTTMGEIDAFAALYPHDVRPPQPLDGCIVKESQ
jgi:hypothetical protein